MRRWWIVRGDEEVFGEGAADALGVEEVEEFGWSASSGRRGSRRSSGSPGSGRRRGRGGGAVVEGDPQFLADAFVPEFGEGFGELDADAVEVEVFGVVAFFAEGVFVGGHVGADGDAGEGDVSKFLSSEF